jgi:L-malate glycosyltransferase
LIGDGPLEKDLKGLTKKLKVNSRVHFLGFVSEEKKFQYLDNSDLYVLSSLHEGFGIVLQEAMQVGLPIVATNNGGQVDILENEVNALIIRQRSSDLLCKAILKVFNDNGLQKKLAKNNKGKVNEFELGKIAREYVSLI